MATKSYSEKLKDPKWQRKRLEILERDNWTCQACGDTEETLHVHHLRYTPGNAPWEYDNSLLLTLCSGCHDDEHINKEECSTLLANSLYEKGFLSYHLFQLHYSIQNTKEFPHHPDLITSTLRWVFDNPLVMGKIISIYLKYLDLHSTKINSEDVLPD